MILPKVGEAPRRRDRDAGAGLRHRWFGLRPHGRKPVGAVERKEEMSGSLKSGCGKQVPGLKKAEDYRGTNTCGI